MRCKGLFYARLLGKFDFGARCKKGVAMAVKQKILLVEDDDALAEVLAEQLALHEEFEDVTLLLQHGPRPGVRRFNGGSMVQRRVK